MLQKSEDWISSIMSMLLTSFNQSRLNKVFSSGVLCSCKGGMTY